MTVPNTVRPDIARSVRYAAAVGMSATEASRLAGCSRPTVTRAADILGLTLRAPIGRPPQIDPAAIDPWQSWVENGRRLGVSARAISDCARKHGIARRRADLSMLTEDERREYRRLRWKFYRDRFRITQAELLTFVGRADLVSEPTRSAA